MNAKEKLVDLVHHTGATGLTDPDSRKWLLIWAAGVVTEQYEIYSSVGHEEYLNELGDICWYTMALHELCFCLGVSVEQGEMSLHPEIDVLEIAKKCLRDGEVRSIPKELGHLVHQMYTDMLEHSEFPAAVDAVVEKLSKRYPNGFSALNSVNRSE